VNPDSRRDPLTSITPDGTIRTQRVIRLRATINSVGYLTHDTVEVVVKCADESAALLAHAGQFCTLKVPGVERPRAYSLARAPHAERHGEHTFFIRLLPDGEISSWFAGSDRTGSVVEIGGPLGRFAIYAILEEACRVQLARDCHFFYGARTVEDLYLADEIATLRAGWHPGHRFEFVPVLSHEPAASDWPGARGWVSDVAIATIRNGGPFDWSTSAAFLCGPPPMIDAGIAALTAAGLPSQNCYYDSFEDARSPAPVIDNVRCVLCDECLLVKPVENCIVETAQLRFDRFGNAVGYEKLAPASTSSLYYNSLFIDDGQCIRCHACVEACPHGAISVGDKVAARTLRQPC